MHCIIAFICRTLLLTFYIVLGRYEYNAAPLDMLDRIVVTCLQACVLGAAWSVYEVCAFVIRVLSRSRAYALLPAALERVSDSTGSSDSVDNTICLLIDKEATDKRTVDAEDKKTTVTDRVATDAADKDTAPTDSAVLDGQDTDAQDTDAQGTDAQGKYEDYVSRVSLDPCNNTRVVFDSRPALARYVAKVHLIGVVVWTTMLSIDYVLTQTSFVFALGMLLGNVAWVLSGPPGRASMPSHVIALYWFLIFSLILVYLIRDGASALVNTENELGMTPSRVEWSQTFVAVNVLLSPASCGFTWTFWIDARTLLSHYHTSLYTSVILSVPVLIFVRGTYLADILSRYTTPWLTYVIFIEPVLKFMTIYVMTLSLDAESVVEMLTVNTSVIGACYLYFEPHDVSFNATVAILVATLVALHLARLTRRALRERRIRQHDNFVLVDD
jgi:hypothetical protein